MKLRDQCCVKAMLTCHSFVQNTCISPARTLTRRAGRGVELRTNAVQEIIRDSRLTRSVVPTGRRAFIGAVRQSGSDALKLRSDGGLLALDPLRFSLVRVGCAVNGIVADCFHAIRMILFSGGIRGSPLATTAKDHQVSFSTEHSMRRSPGSASQRVFLYRGWHSQPLMTLWATIHGFSMLNEEQNTVQLLVTQYSTISSGVL